jgi:hypothetical protein
MPVRNLDNFMLKLIHKNNNKFVMANTLMCMILLLLRLAANMLMNIILIMANLTNLRTEMYPAEGPMLKARWLQTHSWWVAQSCALQLMQQDIRCATLEHPLRSRQSWFEKERAPLGKRQRRRAVAETLPKTWSPVHTRADVPMRMPVPEAYSPKALCA